jgi:hypothetical protein
MKLNVYFYLLNYDFSPEYADAHHNGQPSENNRYYDWEDELVLTNKIDRVSILRHANYVLKGMKGNDTAFEENVCNMILFEAYGVDGTLTQLGCSESILHSYELIENETEFILEVTLEEREPLSNPIPGIYIAASEFPKNLID